MHPEIEKLIAIAKDNGKLTEKQKEIILRKAESLGEDKDEVEFLLETISQDVSMNSATTSNNVTNHAVALSEQTGKEKVNKCPHCGAPITDTMLACPECGFSFGKEQSTTREIRQEIAQLEKKLTSVNAKNDSDIFGESVKKQTSIINSFTLPVTKEGLLYLLDFSYTNCVGADDRRIKKAWYGKAMQAYSMLYRLEKKDPDIQGQLVDYSAKLKDCKKEIKHQQTLSSKIGKGCLIYFIVSFLISLLCIPIAYFDIKGDKTALEQVEMCIQNHDYQGAKAAANKWSGDKKKLIDDISSQEVVYLLSQGEILQAKVVAASINDENKRESIMQSIAATEKMENRNTYPEKNEIVEDAEMQNTNAVTVFKEIMEYIRNEDFQGARAKAGNNQALLDEIAANEVNWYIIQGALGNAKKAAATVHDERKKEELLKEIWEHEFNQ